MKLKKYLDDIDNYRPINLSVFQSLIQSLNLYHHYQLSDIKGFRKGSKYIVESINAELLAELRKLANSPGDDRVSSASQNQSHQHKVNGSLMLVRYGLSHPQVVIFDKNGNYRGYHYENEYFDNPHIIMSKIAIIVENRELFIFAEQTLQFIHQYCMVDEALAVDSLDIIFGMGNEISNPLHQDFLSQYQHLYLLLDIDLGGIMIAKNLLTLLPNTSQTWLYPKDINQRLNNVVEKCDLQQLNQVIAIGKQYPPLQPICQIIAQHMKFLEQESYLYA